MKVSVEDIPTVPVNTKGILIRLREDSGKHIGKLWIRVGTTLQPDEFEGALP